MTPKLSTSDLKEIAEKLRSVDITYFEKIKNQKFNVGDILIKKTIEIEDGLVKESIEMYENSVLPARYLVISADNNTNVAFYKAILENGKLDKDLHCTICFDDISWDEYTIFEVDPSFIDAVILGEEFDIGELLKEEKQRKSRLVKMNRTSATSFKTLKEVNEFVKSLKQGDMIYYHNNEAEEFNSNRFRSVCLKKPRKAKVEDYVETRRWTRHTSRHVPKNSLNDKHVLYVRCMQSQSLITTAELIDKALYKHKPVILKEQL
jgi:hypothetical protein